jgi:uncharacterized protein (DUF1501 family)
MLIKRRTILQGLACTPLMLRSLAAEAAGGNDTIVVVVGLNGGNDGLNTVVPLKQYGAYNTLRTPVGSGGSIAYLKSQLAVNAFNANPATVAASSTEYGFSPDAPLLRKLYATGKLAVINGIGLPATELQPQSHQNAYADWSTGKVNVSSDTIPAGWLGAALDSATPGPLGLTASINGGQPVAVSATLGQGLVVGRPADFNLNIPYYIPQFNLGDSFQKMLNVRTTTTGAAMARSVTNSTLNAVGAMQDFAQLAADYPNPQSGLAQQLMVVAQMIQGRAGIRGYAAVDYGYDTHSGQNNTHPQLLMNMSQAISDFYTYLQKKGLSKNVLIVTISDFGRTPSANLSLGTDHGTASTAFVLGDAVKGGVYGDYPSLTKFDANGNMVVTVDFRNMLSDIIVAMGGNATTVVGKTYPKLGFI